MNFRRVVDVLMTISLMLLMSRQITEFDEAEKSLHEYIGVFMFVLFLVHQYLNRRWYGALLKGRYNQRRIFSTVINFSLLASFILTAFSGIIMSENFQSLNIDALYDFARLAHLSASYLSFVLMGVHLGLHWGMIAGRVKSSWPVVAGVIISGFGLYVFLRENIFAYIFLINQFAFLDYDKNFMLVILENISMFAFWTLFGYEVSGILTGKFRRPVVILACAVILGVALRVWLGVPEMGF